MRSTIPIPTPKTPAPADRPRTFPGPTRDLFFIRFLPHALPNPRKNNHFRALRAVTAGRACYQWSSVPHPSLNLSWKIRNEPIPPLCPLCSLWRSNPLHPSRPLRAFAPSRLPHPPLHHFASVCNISTPPPTPFESQQPMTPTPFTPATRPSTCGTMLHAPFTPNSSTTP